MPIFCNRCGIEIPPGQPVAAWTNGAEMVVVHRFPYQCDERGVQMVRELEKRFEEQKGQV